MWVLCGQSKFCPKFTITLEDLKTRFHHELQESFPHSRFVLLERRRETLFRQCKYKTSKCSELKLHLATKFLRLKLYNGMYSFLYLQWLNCWLLVWTILAMKVCDGIILNITSGNRDKTMTSHGLFGVLDSCIGDWKSRWTLQMASCAGKWKVIILSTIGNKSYGIIRDVLSPISTALTDLATIIDNTSKNFQPKLSKIVKTFQFHTCIHQPHESVLN